MSGPRWNCLRQGPRFGYVFKAHQVAPVCSLRTTVGRPNPCPCLGSGLELGFLASGVCTPPFQRGAHYPLLSGNDPTVPVNGVPAPNLGAIRTPCLPPSAPLLKHEPSTCWPGARESLSGLGPSGSTSSSSGTCCGIPAPSACSPRSHPRGNHSAPLRCGNVPLRRGKPPTARP